MGRGWRSNRGLRVGQSKARMLRRYPGAYAADGRWILVANPAPAFHTYTSFASLAATLRNGHVYRLVSYIGEGGE